MKSEASVGRFSAITTAIFLHPQKHLRRHTGTHRFHRSSDSKKHCSTIILETILFSPGLVFIILSPALFHNLEYSPYSRLVFCFTAQSHIPVLALIHHCTYLSPGISGRCLQYPYDDRLLISRLFTPLIFHHGCF